MRWKTSLSEDTGIIDTEETGLDTEDTEDTEDTAEETVDFELDPISLMYSSTAGGGTITIEGGPFANSSITIGGNPVPFFQ